MTEVKRVPLSVVSTDIPETFSQRVLRRVGQFFCGLKGHDSVLHFEGNRMMMRCTSCGHESPGWEIAGRGYRQYDASVPRREIQELRNA